MDVRDIIFYCFIFSLFVMGIYFNHKLTNTDKDTKGCK